MLIDIKVPQQGLTTEFVTVSEWFVQEGDKVEQGDILGQFESEKAVLDVEATVSGTVSRILKQEGDEADIGAVLLQIEV